MSRYTFVHCQDDGEDSGSINSGEDTLLAVMASVEAIKTLYASAGAGELEIHLWRSFDGPDPVSFVVEHDGHQLVVMDEYGYEYDSAGHRIEAPQAPGA